eukprot:4317-Heterococcus_DN1.PRE.1
MHACAAIAQDSLLSTRSLIPDLRMLSLAPSKRTSLRYIETAHTAVAVTSCMVTTISASQPNVVYRVR